MSENENRQVLWRNRLLIAAATLVAALAVIVVRPPEMSHDAVIQAGYEAIHSIAVLPLENLSGDPQQDYFAEGMTAELITNLGKVSALRVISPNSVMRYKATRKSLSEIARELNVDAVVEGAVQRSADRARITVNLLRAPSERRLWGETYERSLSDVLALEGDIVGAIAAQVRVVVTPEEKARLATNRSVKAEAYEAWIRGRVHMAACTKPDLAKADADFRRAIAIDSNFAPPYAALARLDMIVGHAAIVAPEKVFPEEKRLAEKALQLDSTLAQAWIARADAEFLYERNWSTAQRDYERGLALNPNDDTRDHDIVFVNCWPMFDSLHSDPRFQSLVRRMGLPMPTSPAEPHP